MSSQMEDDGESVDLRSTANHPSNTGRGEARMIRGNLTSNVERTTLNVEP